MIQVRRKNKRKKSKGKKGEMETKSANKAPG